MAYEETKFDDWYADKYLKDKGVFDDLSPEDKDKYQKEFKDFDSVLKYMDFSYDEYKKFGLDAQKAYNDVSAALSGKSDDERAQILEQAKVDLSLNVLKGENETGEDDHSKDWIKEKIKSWDDEWCKAEHSDHPYVFEPISQETDLKFNIYKDEGKTQLGATIHYTSPTCVTLETEEDKVPDFEFFDKLVYEARTKDGVPAVNFANADDMTDEFKAKLALACIKNGVPMVGFDKKITGLDRLESIVGKESFEKLGEDEWIKRVEKYNLKQEYKDIHKHVLEECKDAPNVNVNIAEKVADKSAREAAMIYAAYASMDNVTLENKDKLNPDSHGMFILSVKDKEVLPKDVQTAVNKFNNDVKEKNIEDIRAKVKTNTDPENVSIIAKFNEFDDARNLMNLMMETDAGKSLRTNLDRENHDRDLVLAGKPAKFNVSVKDEDVISFLESLKDKNHLFSQETLETLFPDKTKRGEFLRNTKHPEEQAKLFKERYIEASDVIRKDAKFIKNTKDHHSVYNKARNKFLGHSL